MSNHILVAYASGSGSTAEVAEAIGEVLRRDQMTAEVRSVKQVDDLSPYDAVVVGSSIHFGRWLPEAIAFVETHRTSLARMPVAYFLTCLALINESAESRDQVLTYLEPVLQLAPEIEPVALGLFAGSLNPEIGLIAPGGPYGDFRDWEVIRAWAGEVGTILQSKPDRPAAPVVLGGAMLSFTDMSGVDLSGMDLQGAILSQSKLRDVIMRGADLRETDLTGADLRRANLREASLGWADLERSNASGADLSGANLLGAVLDEADLSRANLSQATLNGARLRGTNLAEADLSRTDLNWADLSGANLQEANLSDASLCWADLREADLTGANLSGAMYNEQTVWPEGFSPIGAGCLPIGGPR
jgi:uncharacterized protein YjbI with pentapeptide repeats/menaquinone-dependent protoporphyrinogen IX oxidase